MPKLKKGNSTHVQGFILYKLCMMKCWARAGHHGKHIDLEDDLHTNYGKEYKHTIVAQGTSKRITYPTACNYFQIEWS